MMANRAPIMTPQTESITTIAVNLLFSFVEVSAVAFPRTVEFKNMKYVNTTIYKRTIAMLCIS